ncbi:hypothetical protein ACF1DW_24265 [Streptomyces sp. NPDC014603]
MSRLVKGSASRHMSFQGVEQSHSNTHRPAKLKHRKVGESA